MYDYLIVGTGLAGSVFAQQMLDRGKTVRMIEQRYHIGGNLYDSQMFGINVHNYGVHIFHTSDEYIMNYVRKFGTFYPIHFQAKAYTGGKLYSSPFNLQTFKQVWGVSTAEEAKAKIQEDCIANDDHTVEGYALRTIGRTLYEMFVETQMKKHWGVEASKLPESYLRRIPVRYTWGDNYFDDTYQMVCRSYVSVIQNMIIGADVDIGVQDFFINRDKYTHMAKRIVYTGEIDRYFNYHFGKLPYRSLTFSYKPSIKLQEADMIRYADNEISAYRSVDYGRLQKTFRGSVDSFNTVISTETAYNYNGDGVPMYPVSTETSRRMYEMYKDLAQGVSQTIFIGRLARFQYLDMHQVIGMSLKAAREEIEAW